MLIIFRKSEIIINSDKVFLFKKGVEESRQGFSKPQPYIQFSKDSLDGERIYCSDEASRDDIFEKIIIGWSGGCDSIEFKEQ